MTTLANAMTRAGALIESSQRIVIVSHENPDPDTVGTALGLAAILRNLGKQVTVLVPSTANTSLASLPGWSTVEWDHAAQQRSVAAADVVISVDNTDVNRFGNLDWVWRLARSAAIPNINIDHHRTNAKFADINVVDPTASACSQVVFDLAVSRGWAIPKTAADPLFAALRSDTGGFAYPANYGRVFKFANALAEAGADVSAITSGQTELREDQMRLLAEVFAATRIDHTTGYAKVTITQAMMQRAGVGSDQAYVAVASLARLEAFRLLAVLIELGPNATRVSIRTRGVAANVIAQSLGGGGHAEAAGVTLQKGVSEAEREVDQAARSALSVKRQQLE